MSSSSRSKRRVFTEDEERTTLDRGQSNLGQSSRTSTARNMIPDTQTRTPQADNEDSSDEEYQPFPSYSKLEPGDDRPMSRLARRLPSTSEDQGSDSRSAAYRAIQFDDTPSFPAGIEWEAYGCNADATTEIEDSTDSEAEFSEDEDEEDSTLFNEGQREGGAGLDVTRGRRRQHTGGHSYTSTTARDAVIHAHIPHGAEDEEDERVEPKRMNTGVARRMMPIPEQSE